MLDIARRAELQAREAELQARESQVAEVVRRQAAERGR